MTKRDTLVEVVMAIDVAELAGLSPDQVAQVKEQLQAMPYADPDGARAAILRMALAGRRRFIEEAKRAA